MEAQKIALITGVSRETGLGLETAKQLLELDLKVIITARDVTAVNELAEKIGAYGYALDITNDASIDSLYSSILSEYGQLDILINNAGAYFDQGASILDADMSFVKEAIDTNLLGAWRMINAFLPLLKLSVGGRIVNVSSGAGSFSDPIFGLSVHPSNVPVYGLTKLALNGLTVKYARELADTKIKINAVCPGFVATYPGTEQMGARPVADGAKGIVWAATIPDDGPNGQFFRDGQKIGW